MILINGGEGAPLSPLFHQLITTQQNINLPSLYFKYWRNFKYNNYKKTYWIYGNL